MKGHWDQVPSQSDRILKPSAIYTTTTGLFFDRTNQLEVCGVLAPPETKEEPLKSQLCDLCFVRYPAEIGRLLTSLS